MAIFDVIHSLISTENVYSKGLLLRLFCVSASLATFLTHPLPAQERSINKGLLEEGDTISVPDDIYDMTQVKVKANSFYHKTIQLTEPGVASSFWDLNDNSSNKKSYVLHGDIYLPIGMGGYRWHVGSNFIHTLHFIPQVKVRILQNDDRTGDASLPVRTPSYMPRFSWYFTKPGWWHQDAPKWSYYAGLSAFHHSNGQDGDEINADGTVNTYNGNFGEQAAFEVLVGGLYSRKTTLRGGRVRVKSIRARKEENTKQFHTIIVPDSARIEKYFRLGYEFHPKSLTNQDFLQYDLYGRHRLNYNLGFRRIKKYDTEVYSPSGGWQTIATEWAENYRITLHGTLIAGPFNTGNINSLSSASLADRLNIHLTYYHMFKGADNAALFIRGSYMGSDEYNIYFQDRVWLLRAGLSFGFFNHN